MVIRLDNRLINRNISFKSGQVNQNHTPIDKPVHNEGSEKKINYKTALGIAGVLVLSVLGIKYGKSVLNMFKSVKNDPLPFPIQSKNNTVGINPVDVKVSFEPERMFGYVKPRQKSAEKPRIYITQDGKLYQKQTEQKPTEQKRGFGFGDMFRPNKTSDYKVSDAIDDITTFAIFDDLMRGGSEIKSMFGSIKDMFKGGVKPNIDDIPGGAAAGDFFASAAERTSDFFSGVADSIGDALGGIGDVL